MNDQHILRLITKNGSLLCFLNCEFFNRREFILAAVKNWYRAIEFASTELRNDREIVLEAVRHSSRAAQYASINLQKDREILLLSLKDGLYSAYHHKVLVVHTDRNFILKLAEINGVYALMAMKLCEDDDDCDMMCRGVDDREIVLAAVKNKGLALKYASAELRADREIVLAAVKNYGLALKYASAELLADREIVLVAVKNNGLALKYASDELRADREIVLAAVVENGRSLRFADAELCGDYEIVTAAIINNYHSNVYIGEILKLAHRQSFSREFYIQLIKKNPNIIHVLKNKLKSNNKLLLHAIKAGEGLRYASKSLQGQRKIVLSAVKHNGREINYASDKLKADREIVLTAAKTYNDVDCIISKISRYEFLYYSKNNYKKRKTL